MRYRKFLKSNVLVAVLIVSASLPAMAGKVSLAWNPVPGATGYRLFIGTEPGVYDDSLDVGPNTAGTLTGLQNCRTHYMAVKAYNQNGESEQFSSEIAGWPRPRIAAGPSTVLMQGSQVELTLQGQNFQAGAEIRFDERSATGELLVRVESIDVISCTEIAALLSVEPLARGFRAMEVGEHPLRVLNPGSVYASKQVQIEFDPTRLDINRSSADTEDKVDGMDLVWLAYAHGAGEGHARYNPDADLNGDGFVDGEDLAYLASRFGACWDGQGWTSEDCPE